MSIYEVTLLLRSAEIRVTFDNASDLEEKLQNLELDRVAGLIDGAMDDLPHPPDRESTFQPPSSPRLE